VSFNDGILVSATDIVPVIQIPPDTIRQRAPAQVRWLYLHELRKYAPQTNTDGWCLVLQFGYINVIGGSLEKVWMVHPEGFDYPLAYILDNGHVLSYDRGIVLM
jgi:hypothetical protein